MSVWSGMSSRLIVLIYAPMLMGKRQKSGEKLIKRASESLVFSYFIFFTQYAVPLLLTALILTPVFGVAFAMCQISLYLHRSPYLQAFYSIASVDG